MFEDIKNKKVLITGASGGMGSCMAKLFASYGARVGLHYIASEKNEVIKLLKEIQEKLRGEAEIFQADFLDSQERKNLVKSFIKRFGGIDVLINNAGATYDYKNFSELSEKSWDNTFAVNVKAPFYLSGEAFNYMKKHGGGRIINISSINVKYGGSARSFHYCASKAALDALTIGFAHEGAKYNILVNSIRPGVIDTQARTKTKGYNEEDFRRRIKLIPLKRVGRPIDIAKMALFLASESANFATGAIFTIAGGE